MDTATLQPPRTGGRSRFSKALPMPPSLPTELASEPIHPARQVPRALPELPNIASTAAFPLRKDSVGPRLASKPIDSPLPALPAHSSLPELQKKMPPIPRKAVASPPPLMTSLPSQPVVADSAKLHRSSSISSLLSAYSNTSTDSAQMSSQRSSDTKGSEPSFSPEREVASDKSYKAYSRNPYEEPSAQEKEMMMREPLPPPPPKKDATASSKPMPRSTPLPATPRSGTPGTPVLASPSKHGDEANGSPPRREIWRRRASSKSDRNIAVSGLKLAVSHGSTAATTAPLLAPGVEHSQSLAPGLENQNSIADSGVDKPSSLTSRSTSALPTRDTKPQWQQFSGDAGSDFEIHSRSGQPAETRPPPPLKDSPTLKIELAPVLSSSARPGVDTAGQFAKLHADTVSPLSSPELPAKSLRRREVGAKQSLQNMRSKDISPVEATPAQHLREARSAIDLKAGRSERVNREAAQESLSFDPPALHENQVREGLPSPRARRPSNSSQRRVASPPQIAVTSPSFGMAPSQPIEYKEQEPIQLTPAEEKTLNDAIGKIAGRNWNWPKVSTNKHGVWPCKELTNNHLTCMSDHRRWLLMENANYPLACMLCHGGYPDARRLCKTCGMRVCLPCADLLTGRKIEELDFDALANKEKRED